MTRDKQTLPPETDDADTALTMSWVAHLTELRSRLLKTLAFFAAAFALCYPAAHTVLDVLFLPLQRAMDVSGGTHRVIFTSLAEGFLTHVALAAFAAVFLTFPFFLYQAWRFVAPALHPSEKKAAAFVMATAPFLFVAGVLFSFYVVMPAAFRFLLGFQQLGTQGLPVMLEAKLSDYLYFIIHLVLAFGLGFQFPVLLYLLVAAGVCARETLCKARRYVVVCVFVFAAVVTPPDIVSQIALAFPLLALFEITLWLLKKKSSV